LLSRTITGRHADQDVARAHFLFRRYLLDGVVIDLVHRRVGQRFLAGLVQQGRHQQLVAVELKPFGEFRRIAEFLVLRLLRDDDHVGHEADQVVFLGVRGHRRDLPGFGLDNIQVALMDFDAVHLGDHRVLGVLRVKRGGEQQGGRERASG
jgi:hypothetical protein